MVEQAEGTRAFLSDLNFSQVVASVQCWLYRVVLNLVALLPCEVEHALPARVLRIHHLERGALLLGFDVTIAGRLPLEVLLSGLDFFANHPRLLW